MTTAALVLYCNVELLQTVHSSMSAILRIVTG